MKEPKTVQTVAYQDGDWWIVQGLEHDICAQGKTLDIARYRFQVAKVNEADDDGSLKRIPPAPEKFWQMKRDS